MTRVKESLLMKAEEKSILITGAASGIGRAAARAFLERGYTVYALDMEEIPAEEGLCPFTVDVRDEAALDARIGELVRAEVLRYLQEQGISPEPEEPADLQKALAELPDEERAVVTLRLGLGEDPGLSQAETAQKLGVPEERVSLLLKRGLQRIRRHL